MKNEYLDSIIKLIDKIKKSSLSNNEKCIFINDVYDIMSYAHDYFFDLIKDTGVKYNE